LRHGTESGASQATSTVVSSFGRDLRVPSLAGGEELLLRSELLLASLRSR
jgi:hypothetical protein